MEIVIEPSISPKQVGLTDVIIEEKLLTVITTTSVAIQPLLASVKVTV